MLFAHQTQQVLDEIARHDSREAIIKIVYHVPENANDLVDVSVIQHACREAWCVASIVPVHKPKIREKRVDVIANMSENELLRVFCKNKNIPSEMVDRVLLKALEIKGLCEQQDEIHDS